MIHPLQFVSNAHPVTISTDKDFFRALQTGLLLALQEQGVLSEQLLRLTLEEGCLVP